MNLPNRVIYENLERFRSDGSIDCYKARLVVLENKQEYVLDYDETFALVSKMTTVHIVLALVASQFWPLHQMDVKNTFLHGDLMDKRYNKSLDISLAPQSMWLNSNSGVQIDELRFIFVDLDKSKLLRYTAGGDEQNVEPLTPEPINPIMEPEADTVEGPPSSSPQHLCAPTSPIQLKTVLFNHQFASSPQNSEHTEIISPPSSSHTVPLYLDEEITSESQKEPLYLEYEHPVTNAISLELVYACLRDLQQDHENFKAEVLQKLEAIFSLLQKMQNFFMRQRGERRKEEKSIFSAIPLAACTM
ncbi:hypothetical protein CR513_37977, partial [Mucuna pruriens]